MSTAATSTANTTSPGEDMLLLSGKFIKESNLSKSNEWKSRTFELWSSGLLAYKNRVGMISTLSSPHTAGFTDERNIKEAAFRIIEKKVPLPGKKSVIIKALEIKTANRKLTIAFHAESAEKNITHLEGFRKVIKENFHRDFLEDEPLSGDRVSADSKPPIANGIDSDDSGDDEPPIPPSQPSTVPSKESQAPTTTSNDVASTTPPKPTTVGLDILKGNKDGIILGVIFGVFAFLLVVVDFLLKKV